MDSVHAFYGSNEWKSLSLLMKQKSNGICADCGQLFPYSELRAHHIIELNIDNVSNPKIALNQDNIKVVCHNCHQTVEHKRMGNIQKKIVVVYGAPFSGKKSYVNAVATRYDLVVDLDRIQDAIVIAEPYDKPGATKRIAFDIRDLLYDKIMHRTGQWECAYVIALLPTQLERDDINRRLGGVEFLELETSKEECIKRVLVSELSESVKNNQIKWINKYFNDKS